MRGRTLLLALPDWWVCALSWRQTCVHQSAEWIFGLSGALHNLAEMGDPGTCPPVHLLPCVYNTWSIPQSIYAHGPASMCKRNTLRYAHTFVGFYPFRFGGMVRRGGTS